MEFSGIVFYGPESFLTPNHQYQSNEVTQSINPNHWPGLILSASTIGLSIEGTFLPLLQLSGAETGTITKASYKAPLQTKSPSNDLLSIINKCRDIEEIQEVQRCMWQLLQMKRCICIQIMR